PRTPRIMSPTVRRLPAGSLRGLRSRTGCHPRVRGCDRARARQVSMPPGRRCPHVMSHPKSLPRRSRASSTTSATCSRSAMANSSGTWARVAGVRAGSDRRCARRSAKDTSGGLAGGAWKPPTTEPGATTGSWRPGSKQRMRSRRSTIMADQSVSQFLLQRLGEWGVDTVFAYPGDGINGIVSTWSESDDAPRFVQSRHEEMSAFEAVGYAKFTGGLGVCMATSGPGAIHLLNGLYDAKL